MFEHWNGLFLVVGIGLTVIVISEMSRYFREKYLIKKGVLPPISKTTDKEITRLKNDGYSVWAIKRYRQLNKGASLKQARKHVESL